MQLEVAQESELGVDLGGPNPLVVSSIGQADDVVLVSNDIHALQCLLDLSLQYCLKHHVSLRAEKTKLQVFSDKKSSMSAYYGSIVSSISFGGQKIEFEDEAEHVGLIRSTSGNLVHISNRFIAHKKCLAAVLPVGLARRHRANPAASIRIHSCYATPVLLSWLPSLVMNSSEVKMVDSYLKVTQQNLLKLMKKTPACVVHFLAGTLPGTALLHMRQLSLFGMITKLPESLLNIHGINVLTTAPPSASSWFQQIRQLCLLYQLPHPLKLLYEPLSSHLYKKLVKSKIINYWELQLRNNAKELSSLPYFKPAFMSLAKPHPMWTACRSNPFECHKAVITARMLSGRYPTDKLQRHWTQNKHGKCLLPNCSPPSEGSLEHLLLNCPSLASTRSKLLCLLFSVAEEHIALAKIIYTALYSSDQSELMQLLLDCTSMHVVIESCRVFNNHIRDRLLYLGRTWCYNIHRERMSQLGLFEFR